MNPGSMRFTGKIAMFGELKHIYRQEMGHGVLKNMLKNQRVIHVLMSHICLYVDTACIASYLFTCTILYTLHVYYTVYRIRLKVYI